MNWWEGILIGFFGLVTVQALSLLYIVHRISQTPGGRMLLMFLNGIRAKQPASASIGLFGVSGVSGLIGGSDVNDSARDS